jgi:hypothetical protein
MGKIQIDEELFWSIVAFVDPSDECHGADWLEEDIRKRLDAKIDKMIDRVLFTRYKRAPSGPEREAARREYLDRRGIHPDWRTEVEQHFPAAKED